MPIIGLDANLALLGRLGAPISLLIALALALQNINPAPIVRPPGYADVRAMAVPVISGDISDRPYRVVSNIETNVRKLTIFEKDPSQARVYRELWERARKLGADAVINAKYGETLYGGWTWGRRHASGQAIKFLTDAEIAEMKAQGGLPSETTKQAPSANAKPRPNTATAAPKKKPAISCVTCD